MKVKIYKLESSDAEKFSRLVDAYEDAFEMEKFEKPSAEYYEQMLSKESVIVFAAEKNNEIIGGLTAHILYSNYSEAAEVYIYDLAVKTEFQRQGIGTKLMTAIKEYCEEINVSEVFLQADKIDEHAVKFYNKIGGRPEDEIIHFSFPINK